MHLQSVSEWLLVSAPSGQITTITLVDGAPILTGDRLVNLYRGRGVPPVYLDLDLDLADIRFYIHGTHLVLLEILHHRPPHPHL